MVLELLVLRHAEAEDAGPDTADFQRRLTAKGRRDAERMGRWLRQAGLVPDHAATSTAARAHETAALAFAAAGLPAARLAQEPGAYDARPDDLLAIVRAFPAAARRAALVGHNPGLSALVAQLSGRREAHLSKCDAAVLLLPGPWSESQAGGAVLDRLVRARDL